MDGEGERFLRIHGGPLYEACRHYRRNLYDVEGQEEVEEVEDFLLDRGTGRVYLLLPEVEAPGLLEEMVRRRFFDVIEDGKGQATMVVGHPETIARLQEALE